MSFPITLSVVLQLSWVCIALHLLTSFLLRLQNSFLALCPLCYIHISQLLLLWNVCPHVCHPPGPRRKRPDLWPKKGAGVEPPDESAGVSSGEKCRPPFLELPRHACCSLLADRAPGPRGQRGLCRDKVSEREIDGHVAPLLVFRVIKLWSGKTKSRKWGRRVFKRLWPASSLFPSWPTCYPQKRTSCCFSDASSLSPAKSSWR